MIDLGLTGKEREALLRALTSSDRLVGASCQVLRNDMTLVGELSPKILDGQVNIDVYASVARQLTMTLFDPDVRIDVDLRDGSPRLDRMVRVYYEVFVPEYNMGWVPIPVFTGPITKTRRSDGGLIEVEGMGKESLSMQPSGRSRTWSKGVNRVALIKAIMRELSGERSFRFPHNWKARTARPLTLSADVSHPWSHARRQAHDALGVQLFYDALGFLRLRRKPVRPVFVFETGDGGTILTPPDMTDDAEAIINTVIVVGAVPKGKKKPIRVKVELPPSDPYSSWSLGRNGIRSFKFQRIDDDTIRSKAEAKKVAKRLLDQARIEVQKVTFGSLPIPLLEEDDPIRVDAEGVNATVRMKQMSVPLGHAGVSTVGYIASVSKRRGR